MLQVVGGSACSRRFASLLWLGHPEKLFAGHSFSAELGFRFVLTDRVKTLLGCKVSIDSRSDAEFLSPVGFI